MLWYVDVFLDRAITSFDRYVIRSADAEAATAAVTSTMVEFDKIDVEPAPDEAEVYLRGLPDDQMVLISAGNEAKFIGNGG